jgi:hypothetical protein
MKALFGESLKGQIDRFVSIDGGGLHITNNAVGSHRYRVAFNGPGGHSFGAFGRPNPAHALGRAAAKIADLQVPSQPKTTFNIGRIGGGTSVNAIPFEAWMEIDMRSSDRAALAALDAQVQAAIDSAVMEENARWGHPGGVTVKKELVGDRPAGSTPDGVGDRANGAGGRPRAGRHPCTRGGVDRREHPDEHEDSGDHDRRGGQGSDAHALTEWFDTEDSWKGTQNAVLLAIALAQK